MIFFYDLSYNEKREADQLVYSMQELAYVS